MTTHCTSSPIAESNAESDNQDALYNRIHLAPSVPYGTTQRAKALCGAKLREKTYYTTVIDGMMQMLEPTDDRVWVYQRVRQQHTMARVSGFRFKVCPGCIEHEDYVLALLAGPP